MAFQSLFDYQREAVNRTLNALFMDDRKAVLISLPTGAGKTIVFSAIIREAIEHTDERALILVHRDTLLTQTIDKISYVWPEVSCGRIKGDIREYDRKVMVASVQTLANHIDEFIASLNRYGKLKIAVIDEAHHSLAPAWMAIFTALRDIGVKILGVTATPIRTNKAESLADIFETVAYNASIFQLIQDGYLSPIIGYRVSTSLSLKGIKTSRGDYNVNDLARRIAESNFNALVVRAWKEKAAGRRTICFATSIPHVDALVKRFTDEGVRAVGVHGEISVEEQRRRQKDFADGKYDVLINCMLLTEGYDEPSINCVLMARPTMSRTLYVQMLGRGLRTHPGKRDCLLIDLVSNTDHSLVTMQDLLGFYGMKKAEDIYKKNADQMSMTISPATIPSIQAVDAFGDEYYTSLAYHKVDVFDINDFPWIEMNGSYYVTARENLSVAIQRDRDDKYIPYLVINTPGKRAVAQLVSAPVDKTFALAIANVYLFDYGNKRLTTVGQAWRNEPPSDNQRASLIRAIERYQKWFGDATFDLKTLPQLKGTYSDAITAIYSASAIKSRKIPRITRDEAIEMLRDIVLAELGLNKHREAGAHKEKRQFHLAIAGEYTAAEHAALTDMLISLSADRYGEYPVKFLAENQIYIADGVVKVIASNPLTEKQLNYLNDRINRIFRLYFRNKRFEIEVPKKAASAAE